MLCFYNWARHAHGLPLLRRSRLLTTAAVNKARRIERCRQFRHDPCGDWGIPPLRLWGENLAYGYPTKRSVMAAWLRSPEHRANILNPGFRLFGAVQVSGFFRFLWTVDLGA